MQSVKSGMQPAIRFTSEEERRKLTAWCGVFAALGWVILEVFFELLFGPHIRLTRSMAVGSGIGAAAGLLSSSLQWLLLHKHTRDAARLIPAITASSTLAGLIGGLLLYYLNGSMELYGLTIPLQGVAGAVFVSLATARLQWSVFGKWAAPEVSWIRWAVITTAGSVVGAVCACIAAATITGVFGPMLDRSAWPYVLFVAYLTAGLAGGAIYGSSVVMGLRRLLPSASGQTDETLRGGTPAMGHDLDSAGQPAGT